MQNNIAKYVAMSMSSSYKKNFSVKSFHFPIPSDAFVSLSISGNVSVWLGSRYKVLSVAPSSKTHLDSKRVLTKQWISFCPRF